MATVVEKCDGCGACASEGKMDSVNCRLCGGVTYCNAQCASEAWASHAQDCNLHKVPTVNTLVAMPYAFQDLIPGLADEYETESHLVHHVNPAGLVSSRILAHAQPTLVAIKEAPLRYALALNGAPITGTASGKTDCIASKAPGKAGKLAAQRLPSQGVTLWTPLSEPISLDALQEPVTLSVLDKTKEPAAVVASICFQLPKTLEADVFVDYSRKAKALIQSQLSEKQTTLAGVTPLVVQDAKSTVRLLVEGGKLVDVEYQLAGAEVPEWSTTKFQCDSRDIDHVAGLLMAISERIDAMEYAGEDVSAQTGDYHTIHDHFMALHENLSAEPSPSVNAAIHRSIQAQFAQVGGFFQFPAESVKLAKNRNDPAALLLQMESYVVEAEDPSNVRWWRLNLQLAKAAESRLSTLKQKLNTTLGAWKSEYTAKLSELRGRMEDVRQSAPSRTKGQLQRRFQGAKKGFEEQTKATEADKTRARRTDFKQATKATVVTNVPSQEMSAASKIGYGAK